MGEEHDEIPEAVAPPELSPRDRVEAAEVESDAADFALVTSVVNRTHSFSTSLLHGDSGYVEFPDEHRIEQHIGG